MLPARTGLAPGPTTESFPGRAPPIAPPSLKGYDLFLISVDTRTVLQYNCVMKDVTITLDEEVACWAWVRAAEKDTSVSRLAGKMLQEMMIQEQTYRASKQQYLSQRPKKLKKSETQYPRREELHEQISNFPTVPD